MEFIDTFCDTHLEPVVFCGEIIYVEQIMLKYFSPAVRKLPVKGESYKI
jgi:hypothetical protein